MNELLSSLPPNSIDTSRMAVFLDFDGTLVDFAAHPEDVFLAPSTRRTVARLQKALGGAVAVVTGRNIGDIDSFLDPVHLPVAGVHGMERRSHGGVIRERPFDVATIERIAARLAPLLGRGDGLLLERKRSSLALHYRSRPDLESECARAMDAAVAGLDQVHLLRGKMVIEAKAGAGNKGEAVGEFLAEPPFAGRVPYFAGDDVTDEDAFAAVNALGGFSIKVGPGMTCARYRAASIPAFLEWLDRVAGQPEEATVR